MSDPSSLSRDILKDFLPNPRAIRAFESLINQVGVKIPTQINVVVANIETLQNDISTLNDALTALTATVNNLSDTVTELQSILYGARRVNLDPLIKRIEYLENKVG